MTSSVQGGGEPLWLWYAPVVVGISAWQYCHPPKEKWAYLSHRRQSTLFVHYDITRSQTQTAKGQ